MDKRIINKIYQKYNRKDSIYYIMICRNCGNKFEIKKCHYNAGKGNYCSNKCCTTGHIGIKHNPENHIKSALRQFKNGMPQSTKDKLRLINTGKKQSIKTRKKRSRTMIDKRKNDKEYVKRHKDAMNRKEIKEKCARPHIGRIQSIKERQQRSKSLKKYYIEHPEIIEKTKHIGKNNGMWNGGSSFEPYLDEWTESFKNKIRIRDNFTCQMPGCNIHQDKLKSKLSIHHIDYNKQNNEEKNLISLCNSCHSKTNYNRQYWKNLFIQNQIKMKIMI